MSEFIRGWGWGYLTCGSRGPEVIVTDRYKGPRWSEKRQNEHCLTVERSPTIITYNLVSTSVL